LWSYSVFAHHLKDSIPVIKRFSGGGTVIVDENTLFVTFVCDDEFLNEYKTKLYPIIDNCNLLVLIL
jgi:lipoate-protein ligase A